MADFWASTLGSAIILLAQGLAVIAFVMVSLIFMVYGDRKIWAAVQMRRGPNVVGPWGLLQTFADALKYATFHPTHERFDHEPLARLCYTSIY